MIEPFAVILALTGAYLVGSDKTRDRRIGFLLWIVSNALWVIQGVSIYDYWMVLQFGSFTFLAIRGVKSNLTEVMA